MRIGIGYDIHRFQEGRPLVLGGLTLPGETGLGGHSDADVLLHAVIDALLGAAGLGDIGQRSPPDDPAYAGADSRRLLAEVRAAAPYRKVTRETFEEVVKLSGDIGVRFGSIEHAASTLGRALADPARGLHRLRSIGIIFTKTEQDKIKALVETNNTLAAQRIILDKVKASYEGLNSIKTPADQWKQIKNDLASIAEKLGKDIYPTAVELGKWVVIITKRVAQVVGFVLQVNNYLGGWPAKIILATAAAWGLYKALLYVKAAAVAVNTNFKAMLILGNQFLFGFIGPVQKGLMQWPGLISLIGTALKAVQAQGLAAGIASLFGPQAIIIAIVAAVVAYVAAIAGLYFYLQRFPIIAEMTAQFWDAVNISVKTIWSAFSQLYNAMRELALSLMPLFAGQFPFIANLLKDGIVPTIAYMIHQLTMGLIVLSSLIKAIATFLRTRKWTFTEELNASLAEMKALQQKRFAKKSETAPGKPPGTGGLLDTNTGMMGLQDAWKNVQEGLLKKDNPAERTADGIESLDGTAKKILELMGETDLSGEGAVA